MAFSDYDETISLLEGYASKREHPNELAILASARVDELANLAARGKTQRERFVSFIEEFSGKRSLLQRVALPNLYYGLLRHYETTFLSLETPGRIRVFNREDEMHYIRFLAASGLPLTERDVMGFLHWFSVEIQRHYRTTATQSWAKPTLDTRDAVIGHLRDAASWRRDKTFLRATDSLDGFLKEYEVEAILYREVRSGAIHEFEFGVNEERFFAEPDLFVDTVRRGYDTSLYLTVEFSAAWLLDLLRDSLRNYKRRLKDSGLLPVSLWVQICDPDREAEMFDTSLLEEPRDIGLAVGR